jgi:excisionase family DNA binding protein
MPTKKSKAKHAAAGRRLIRAAKQIGEPRYVTVSEMAARFRISIDAIYKWIRNGQLPAPVIVRLGGARGAIRIDEQAFLDQLRAGTLFTPKRART